MVETSSDSSLESLSTSELSAGMPSWAESCSCSKSIAGEVGKEVRNISTERRVVTAQAILNDLSKGGTRDGRNSSTSVLCAIERSLRMELGGDLEGSRTNREIIVWAEDKREQYAEQSRARVLIVWRCCSRKERKKVVVMTRGRNSSGE